MENCLVTKLKSNVQNEHLGKLNEIKLTVRKVTSYNANSCQVRVQGYASRPITARATDSHKFYSSFADLQAGINGFTERTVSGSWTFYVEPGDYDIFISSKYEFELFKSGTAVPVWSINVSDLEYSTKLKYVTLLASGNKGDITKVFKLPLLETINLQGGSNYEGSINDIVSTSLTQLELPNCLKLIGDVKYLGSNANLGYVTFTGASNIGGSVEGFVAMSQKNGRSSCASMTFGILNTLIQFNGTTHVSSVSNILSWQPNASDSSNTDVTWNSQTTTIHVNSDGSWTRVS